MILNKNSEPLVSVCLPVFNGEPFLMAAVGSVLTQSYRNFELLVFDDVSTDGSWSLLQSLQDPRMQLHRNTRNLGPEGNWNQALGEAKGKYVKLFHQDDLLTPDCLARQVEALESAPDAVLTFCSRDIIDSNGCHILTRRTPWPEGEVKAETILRSCIRAGTNLVGEPSSVLFRAEVARKAGEFDGKIPYVIDLDYWFRLLDLGSGYCLRNSLASFRISPSQWSAAIGRRQSRQFVDFLEELTATGRCQANVFSMFCGRIMAFRNQILRMLVYRLLLRGAR